jgi:hypothetical protein
MTITGTASGAGITWPADECFHAQSNALPISTAGADHAANVKTKTYDRTATGNHQFSQLSNNECLRTADQQ